MQQDPTGDGAPQGRGRQEGGPSGEGQLHLLRQQMRHLQEAYPAGRGAQGRSQGPPTAGQRNGSGSGPWGVNSDHCQGSIGDLSGWRNTERLRSSTCLRGPRFLPSEARALLESLKKELTGAISQAVDSVLQKVLVDPSGHLTQLGRRFQGAGARWEKRKTPCLRGSARKDPLPLAAQTGPATSWGSAGKLIASQTSRFSQVPRLSENDPQTYQASPADCSLVVAPAHIQEEQILGQLLGHGPGGAGGWSSSGPVCPKPALLRGGPATLGSCQTLRPLALSQQQCPWPFTSPVWKTAPRSPNENGRVAGRQSWTRFLFSADPHILFGPGVLRLSQPRRQELWTLRGRLGDT